MRQTVFSVVFGLLFLVLVPVALAQSPDAEGTIVADTGFRPDINGFAFPNYRSEFPETRCAMLADANCKTFPATNLTADEMRRMFGTRSALGSVVLIAC